MSDARELLEQCAEEAWYTGESTPALTTKDFAPRAFDALRAVVDLADKLHHYGEHAKADGDLGRASAYFESEAQIQHAITKALAGDPR